jgi:hypothetical protein
MNSFVLFSRITGSFLLFLLFIHSASPSEIERNGLDQDTVKGTNPVRKQPVYVTTRLTTHKPVVDGKLDDECWKKGTWAGNFTQWIPNEGAKPTYPTELNIQYDDRYIYVAIRAYDGEPDKILRLSGLRDEFAGDIVGINFDSNRDYRTGFEFNLTAWGQKIDLVLFNPENWDTNWNAVWKGKTGTEDSAWVAEMEIPLSQLRYSRKEEQVWGMHAWRWISRIQEESDWEIQTRTGPGVMYNFGELRGIKGLKPSRRLEIMPFALGELKTMRKEPGNPFINNGREWGGNAGIDAKIGISSNFTVDLTVNPDFGQVESDPSVMNLTAFETFYEEKRPFFLEGLTIFDFDFDNQNLFYSRRIGHAPSLSVNPAEGRFIKTPDKTTILDAVKFSGTTSDGLAVGFIQSLTSNEFARLGDQEGNRSKQEIEPLTNYTIGRIQKGYNEGTTTFGGMITSTNRFINSRGLEFLPANAYTGGVDLLHRWNNKKYFVDAKLIGSYVDGSREAITALQRSSARYYQRPGADYLRYDTTRTSLSGFGGKLRIGKGAHGLWKYSTGVTLISPGLELNDAGYMQSADEINQETEITYFVNRSEGIFRGYNITLEQFNSWNFNGTFTGSGFHLSANAGFTNQWDLGANLIYHSKAIDTRILRGGYDMIVPSSMLFFGNLRTNPSKKLIAGINYRHENQGNNSGSSYEIEPQVTIRPIQVLRIRLGGTYEANKDRLQYVATKDYMSEKRYILGKINQKTVGFTFRVDLNLTPEFSVQYYGSPFVSRGSYEEFKHVMDPVAEKYEDRFSVYSNPVLNNNIYSLDENNDLIPDLYFNNPDFNFHQFRSNLVAKWEYRLGSFIYLVWSSERTSFTDNPGASIKESFRQLGKVIPSNIFLIKLSYWFSL